MSLNSSPTKPTSPSHGRSRNFFLSKFRSQLGHRNRSITDFYIEPDDPWRTYSPGDSIKGTVVLTVVRPVRVTHLVICLHGFVKVFKNTVASAEVAPDIGFLGPGRGRRGSEYLGNGLATLFEDEVVLCGEGRLKEGIYKFRFDMLFPPYALPSSITFERGTISYMLTSTLTKPTTINPTLSCRRRVNFLENIDIAPFPAPKPRVVTLEPVSRRSKSKAKSKSTGTDRASDNISLATSANGTVTSGDHCAPLSPAPSEISSSSRRSDSTQSLRVATDPGSSTSGHVRSSEAYSTTPSLAEKSKSIVATAEVLRSGVLPGDILPVKVSINHCKQVRSPHGIIVTLYRQGRIDLHPTLPIGSTADGKKPVYEDCYPRSRTGLGGLTLGSTRMSSVFRKDLSQTFAPLIVDPTTMTAVIKTSIRVPEDSFPTITRVPGGLISFRYYIEVVADLRGKLAAPDFLRPRFNMVSNGKTFSPSGQLLNSFDSAGNSITANWGDNILDTDQIRREKGVIALVFEVVIGTRDSARRMRRGSSASTGEEAAASQATNSEQPFSVAEDDNGLVDENGAYVDYSGQDDYDYTHGQDWTYPPDAEAEESHIPNDQILAPPPQTEEPVDEKTRLRRAEEMLLPSQPPDERDAGPSTMENNIHMPTAPVLPEDDHIYDYQHLPGPSIAAAAPDGGSIRARDFVASSASDDKQELERERLMREASAPVVEGVEGHSTVPGPSAPVFDEDDIVEAGAHGDESLPRYLR